MDILGIVGKATKAFFDVRTISIDNWTYKLYYKISVILVVSCSVIVTSRQFFGSPINCDPGEVRLFVVDFSNDNYVRYIKDAGSVPKVPKVRIN